MRTEVGDRKSEIGGQTSDFGLRISTRDARDATRDGFTMTLIKICGITNIDDALNAVEAGADILGFNFYSESPRYINPDLAREIDLELPSSIIRVGVFVDAPEEFVRLVSHCVSFDYLQFHGDETPYYCEQFATPYWKAFRLKDKSTLELMKKFHPYAYLVDAYEKGVYGGTGQLAKWDLAVKASKLGRIVLAGGINPDNVEEAITTVHPWCIDVCSGVEYQPGIKNRDAMVELVEKVESIGEKDQSRK